MGSRTKRDVRSWKHACLEALEGRAVPATFHVSTAAELQADVAMLNNSSVPNTIVVAPGIYNLTNTLHIENANNLTIQGKNANPGSVNLLAPNGGRVFEIDGGNVTLTALTVAGGNGVAHGGGILSQNAVLTLRNATVSGNTATTAGGGIYAQGGTLNIDTSSILSNGTASTPNSAGAGLAASNATVNITRSTVADNQAVSFTLDTQTPANTTGGGIYTEGGTLTISRTSITRNSVSAATRGPSASSTGGAVATKNTAATVSASKISNNGLVVISAGTNTSQGSAFSAQGGTLTITGSTLSGNSPGGPNQILHPGTTVVLKNTTVDGQKFNGSHALSN